MLSRIASPIFILVLLNVGFIEQAVAFSQSPPPVDLSSGGQWYKGELHKHTWLFGGFRDVGDTLYNLRQLGYNFVFQGEHDWGKLNGYNFTESLHVTNGTLVYTPGNQWTSNPQNFPATPCSTTTGTVELNNRLAHTGNHSMHIALKSAAPSCVGYFWDTTYHDESVSFARGPIYLNFSYYPVRNTPSASGLVITFYINVRAPPYTITLANNTVVNTNIGGLDDGSVQFAVYDNVAPFPDSVFKKAVRLSPAPVLGQWNDYSINLSDLIPKAYGFGFHPSTGPYQLSIRAYSSANAPSDFYIDDFYLYNDNPVPYKAVEAWKNSIIHTWDTPTFKTFGAFEMSYLHHINYLGFTTTNPSKVVLSDQIVAPGRQVSDTSKIVNWIQQQGLPAELNHPLTGSSPIPYLGWGADTMDIMYGVGLSGSYDSTGQNQVLQMWDTLLSEGEWIMGDAASDSGIPGTADFALKAPAFHLYAKSLDESSILKSLFEGRSFFARETYDGPLVFNVAQSDAPYPGRYPMYISDQGSQTTVSLYLNVANPKPGWTINWIRNGTLVESDTLQAGQSILTPSFQVPDPSDYFRVEIRETTPQCVQCLVAATNPILFVKVPGLPRDTRFSLQNVKTSDGFGYNRPTITGITAVDFSGSTLQVTTKVPDGAVSTLQIRSSFQPNTVDANLHPSYDSRSGTLTLQVSGSTKVFVTYPGVRTDSNGGGSKGGSDSPPSIIWQFLGTIWSPYGLAAMLLAGIVTAIFRRRIFKRTPVQLSSQSSEQRHRSLYSRGTSSLVSWLGERLACPRGASVDLSSLRFRRTKSTLDISF